MTPKPAHHRLLVCVLLGMLSLTARAAEPAPQRAGPLANPAPTGALLPYGTGYEQRLRTTVADTPPEEPPPTPVPQQADAPRGTSGPGGHGSGGGRSGGGTGGGGGRGGGRGR